MYLSSDANLDLAMDLLGLSIDEIEMIVGRFRSNSQWAGKLRGEVFQYENGVYGIMHHFTKKVLWVMESNSYACTRQEYLERI